MKYKLKKTFRAILLLQTMSLLSLTSLAFGQVTEIQPESSVQKKITTKEWNEDLDYLVKRYEIMHPGLYTNVSKEKFNAFVDTLKLRSATESGLNMIIGIMELVAMIKDGHTGVNPTMYNAEKIPETIHWYPIRVYYFSDGLYAISAIKKYEAIIGKKIIRIGKLTTEDVIKKWARTKAADNKIGEITDIYFVKEIFQYYDILDDSDKLKLVAEDTSGNKIDFEIESEPLMDKFPKMNKNIFPMKDEGIITLNENSSNQLPLWLSRIKEEYSGEFYWFEYLPTINGIYLQINAMVNNPDENFNMFCDRLFKEFDKKKAVRLIIDIRNNNGGNHFELPLLKGIISRPDLDKSDKLFVITSRVTFSASQHLAIQLDRYTNATSFGEPTGARPNTFGAIRRFTLPNSELGAFCSVQFIQNSEADDYRALTEPDFFVPLTSNNYKNNEDPVLEAISKYDEYKKLRPEFLENMSNAFLKGGLEELKTVYSNIKPNYIKYGFNMENLLYKDLDSWMYRNKKSDDEYINYLKFMHEELPNSVDVSSDLATWLETRNIEEAKKYYKNCLELNPAHSYAKMKLKLMELESME